MNRGAFLVRSSHNVVREGYDPTSTLHLSTKNMKDQMLGVRKSPLARPKADFRLAGIPLDSKVGVSISELELRCCKDIASVHLFVWLNELPDVGTVVATVFDINVFQSPTPLSLARFCWYHFWKSAGTGALTIHCSRRPIECAVDDTRQVSST